MRPAGPRRRGGEGDPGPGCRSAARARPPAGARRAGAWAARAGRCEDRGAHPRRNAGCSATKLLLSPFGGTESGRHGEARGQTVPKRLADKSEGLRGNDTKRLSARLSVAQVELLCFPSQQFLEPCLLEFGGVGSSSDGWEGKFIGSGAVLIPPGSVTETASDVGSRGLYALSLLRAPRPAQKIPRRPKAICQMCRPGLLSSKGSRRTFPHLRILNCWPW